MPMIKSENDRRSYRLIELSNGLKALLVSSAAQQPESAVKRSARKVGLRMPLVKTANGKMGQFLV